MQVKTYSTEPDSVSWDNHPDLFSVHTAGVVSPNLQLLVEAQEAADSCTSFQLHHLNLYLPSSFPDGSKARGRGPEDTHLKSAT